MEPKESMLAAVARAAGLDQIAKPPVASTVNRMAVQAGPPGRESPRQLLATAPSVMSAPKSFHEQILADWKADAALQTEFGSLGAYSAWREQEHCKKTGIRAEQLRAQHPDVTSYITGLEKAGLQLSSANRLAINGYAETWRASSEIRAEFGSFAVFASYMRAKDGGRARIFSR